MPASLSMVFTELLEQAGGAGFFQALQVLTSSSCLSGCPSN